MTKTVVRQHPRIRTRGVREHKRFVVRLSNPVDTDYLRTNYPPQEEPLTRAFVYTGVPEELIVHRMSGRDVRHVENILSHETLHGVLTERGEVDASILLDSRRDMKTRGIGGYWSGPTRNGLYPYKPKRRRNA